MFYSILDSSIEAAKLISTTITMLSNYSPTKLVTPSNIDNAPSAFMQLTLYSAFVITTSTIKFNNQGK